MGVEHLHSPKSLPPVTQMIEDAQQTEANLIAEVGFEHQRRPPVPVERQKAGTRHNLGSVVAPIPAKGAIPSYKKLPRQHRHKTGHTPKVTKRIRMGHHRKG